MDKRSYSRRRYLLAVPKDPYIVDDAVLAMPLHRLRPVDQDLLVLTESADTGLVISRVARLLSAAHRVYVKTDDHLWAQHFHLDGEAQRGFSAYSRRP